MYIILVAFTFPLDLDQAGFHTVLRLCVMKISSRIPPSSVLYSSYSSPRGNLDYSPLINLWCFHTLYFCPEKISRNPQRGEVVCGQPCWQSPPDYDGALSRVQVQFSGAFLPSPLPPILPTPAHPPPLSAHPHHSPLERDREREHSFKRERERGGVTGCFDGWWCWLPGAFATKPVLKVGNGVEGGGGGLTMHWYSVPSPLLLLKGTRPYHCPPYSVHLTIIFDD